MLSLGCSRKSAKCLKATNTMTAMAFAFVIRHVAHLNIRLNQLDFRFLIAHGCSLLPYKIS